ncbi:MAG: hypothetical protein HRU19_05390 [Pseudobacteriovorax sp.]|nr:hypothetical protein [Pseudobacteriovorax sp.]
MIRYLVGAISASLSLGAMANEAAFEQADALFAERENNIEATQQARDAYLSIAATASSEDLVRAVVGAARTLIYEGEALTGRDSDEDIESRRSIFRSCYTEVMPLINPEALGFESPAYYYFTASCMAYYAEVSGTLENLRNIRALNEALENGLSLQGGELYEGGGLNRVKAAVKSNPKAKPIPGGLYNPEVALELIEAAIEGEAYPGGVEGALFCDNFRRKVNVLAELDRSEEALEVAEIAIDEFGFLLELDEIPSVIVAETKHCIKVIEEIAETL